MITSPLAEIVIVLRSEPALPLSPRLSTVRVVARAEVADANNAIAKKNSHRPVGRGEIVIKSHGEEGRCFRFPEPYMRRTGCWSGLTDLARYRECRVTRAM